MPNAKPFLNLPVDSKVVGPFNVMVSAAASSPSIVSPCTVKLPLVPIVTVVPSSDISPVT